MRYFQLLNIQHYVLFVCTAIITVVLLALALGYTHFRARDSEERQTKIIHTYPSEIEERDAPFPLFLALVILGTVLWGIGYIVAHGLYGVKI
ncbi:MAG: cytochrome c oxidase subunit II transmembrane domain-containing protein [Syntrophobacteraceae bacterium]